MKNSLQYQVFPRSVSAEPVFKELVQSFELHYTKIDSFYNDHSSNKVLKILTPSLIELGYEVETSKKANDKIKVPVLFSRNNHIDKSFDADAVNWNKRIVLEVEAGRACDNNQFLKDIFQASMMYDIDYLAIAVRNVYRKKHDFEKVYAFLETLYINGRLKLPLKGIVLIGY
jgi:hypothetical protein